MGIHKEGDGNVMGRIVKTMEMVYVMVVVEMRGNFFFYIC